MDNFFDFKPYLWRGQKYMFGPQNVIQKLIFGRISERGHQMPHATNRVKIHIKHTPTSLDLIM